MTANKALRRTVKAVADWIVAALALYVAISLRFDGSPPPEFGAVFLPKIVAVATIKFGILLTLGEYFRIWRYVSIGEALLLGAGSVCGIVVLVVTRALGWIVLPYSVIVIDSVLSLLAFGSLRFARRLQVSTQGRTRRKGDKIPKRTLVLGAGDRGNALLTDLLRRRSNEWKIVGLLDDDPAKHGETLHGVPVLGSTAQLEATVRKQGAEHVIIAMPQAPKIVLRELISRAQSLGVTVQAVPALDRLLRDPAGRGPTVSVTLSDVQDSAEVKRSLLPKITRNGADQTILVTGGAGYIGVHLVRRLLDRGYRVRVLDNFTYGDEGISHLRGNPRLQLCHGDISSVRDVVSAVKDVDSVIALAAIVGDPACGLDAEETLNLNYESTKILVESCNFYGVDRLVFASSCSVYGAAQSELLTEESPLNPVSLYARTRILSEEVIRERCGDVTTVTLRLATVFGLSPRMRFDLVANTLTARAIVDRRIQIFGGDQWRPFVHCQDVAEAFATAATAPRDLVRNETFNVGSTNMNYTLSELGDIVAKIVGDDVQVDHGEFVEDRRNYRVSFDKIERTLGWSPSYTLESGIREMVDAIKSSVVLQDYNQARYSNLKHLTNRLTPSGNLQLVSDKPLARTASL